MSRLIIKKAAFNLEIALRAAIQTYRPARSVTGSPTDVFLCIVDHYEPQLGRPPVQRARERVEDWLRRYPRIACAHRDADGQRPPHCFFYPWDEYDSWELTRIAELCADGFGEIEIHLHHRDDTEASLRLKFQDAIAAYRTHGALSAWPDGRAAWGFIHGNWALANSRCEDGRNYCGVNNEIEVLLTEGCYADFTFPAWQQLAQPRQLNTIYYARSSAQYPKSHEWGQLARAGATGAEGLLLIPGPLVPYFGRGRRGWRAAMDDSDLAAYRRYEPARLDRWVRAGIHVSGRPDCIFIKLHCHGAEDRNREALLGEDLNALFTDAETRYNDGKRYRLHYVTARETFNIIKAIEAGVEDAAGARDFVLPAPPACRRSH